MKTLIRAGIACLAIVSLTTAATPKRPRLTPQLVAELTAPSNAKPKAYVVRMSGIDSPIPLQKGARPEARPVAESVILPVDKPEGVIQAIREVRFPTEFEPPKVVAANANPIITPTIPTSFELVTAGWTIRLSARPEGKLVAVYGVAEYVDVELVEGGYGAIAGPIYTPKGELITPNVLKQPKVQTTTARFHIFALPGEPYDVTLYRGAKAEKHAVTVTLE